MFNKVRSTVKPQYAIAVLTICLGVAAQAANLADIQVFYRLDPWLVSGNYVGGLWVSPPVFGPVTQGGGTFTLETRAQGLDTQGQSVVVTPQWVSSDPSVVMVLPGQGTQVTINVLGAGQSTLTLTYQGISKQLTITATLHGISLLVEISQQQQPTPVPQPSLNASPNVLTFAHQIGGAGPQSQTVNITTNGAGLAVTASSDASWLSVSPGSGSAPSSLRVSVDPARLAAGTYSGTITIASAGAASATIAVILNITEAPRPSLLVSPATLSFSSQSGGPDPGTQSASVASSGATVSYTAAIGSGANWLSAAPASGGTPATLIISVHSAGLAAGTYTGTVAVSSADTSNTLQIIAVTLTVNAPSPGPALSVNPNALTFAYQTGGATPPTQSVAINSTGSALAFSTAAASQFANWLSVSVSVNTTPATLSVAADPRGLAPGTYQGAVTVSASGAGNSPQVIRVTLVITAGPSLTAPKLQFSFGVIDKQVNGSSFMLLTGSGRFRPSGLQGSGKFVEFSSRDREGAAIIRHGTWKAKRFVSFTPATPLTFGSNAAGVLVMELALSPEGGGEIAATLKIVANVPGKGLVTGQPTGVTLAIVDGASYAPTGAGSVAFRVSDAHDDEAEGEERGGR